MLRILDFDSDEKKEQSEANKSTWQCESIIERYSTR